MDGVRRKRRRCKLRGLSEAPAEPNRRHLSMWPYVGGCYWRWWSGGWWVVKFWWMVSFVVGTSGLIVGGELWVVGNMGGGWCLVWAVVVYRTNLRVCLGNWRATMG